MNRVYRRTGSLWEGRYKASLVDTEQYLLACYRYIELNPVRAGMTGAASEYRWSSYRATALGEEDPLLVPHEEYLRLGRDEAARRYAYRELFRHHMEDAALHEIREALNQELVLGSERFKDRIEQMVVRRVRPGKPGRPRLDNDDPKVVVY
ncbi:MAG: hypothetical protein LC646_00530 [Xanthomonadaceae bacterium]|nr:hypothetical protein [Xanthomonadaceae bacterium]